MIHNFAERIMESYTANDTYNDYVFKIFGIRSILSAFLTDAVRVFVLKLSSPIECEEKQAAM